MSFRNKLSLTFCLILALTVMVALISWWGMRNALKSQEELYMFQNSIERTFHELSLQEQVFFNREDLSLSRSVITHVTHIRQKIADAVEKAKNNLRQEQLVLVLKALNDYEVSFSEYSQQHLNLKTIESKMVQESERLLAKIEELGFEAGESGILYNISIDLLLAQNKFLQSPNSNEARQVLGLADKLKSTAHSIRNEASSKEQELKAFRVDIATRAYVDSFNQLTSQHDFVDISSKQLNKSFMELREELSRAILTEAEFSRRHIHFLQSVIIITALVAILFSIAATFTLSAIISKPIDSLKESAQKIVDGDLDVSVKVRTRDEIGELGALFNLMAEKLKQNFDELKTYKVHLEDLVAARTHELELEINERLEAEKGLADSEERFRAIFDSSTDGLLVTDPDTRSFILANPKMCSMLGYTEEELTTLAIPDIHPVDKIDIIQKNFVEIVQGKRRVAKDMPVLRKDRTVFPAEISSSLIQIGDQDYVLGCFRDISERKAMEQERLKARKLESVGVLAGGIAHDFNNILAAILGNVSLSMALISPDQKCHKLLTEVEKATLRARDLTHQLLTFSKGGEPIKELTSVAKIIRESASFILRGSNVRCDYHMPQDLWAAEVDAGQISQVIQNIVTNSQHAMPGGGAINISCTNTIPSAQQAPDLTGKRCLEIRIEDNGTGIPAEFLDRIFDPYFTSKKEGSGLGLAITHSIIKKHNGYISVESSEGQGTAFTILLPAADSDLPVADEQSAFVSDHAQGQILIMDDEPQVLEITKEMLLHLGYSVVTATHGEEALRLYKELYDSPEAIDAVIMDLTIPGGMGGMESGEKILKFDPKAKIIVSSGYSQNPIMANYRQYGFCGNLNKPYHVKDLQFVLSRALS